MTLGKFETCHTRNTIAKERQINEILDRKGKSMLQIDHNMLKTSKGEGMWQCPGEDESYMAVSHKGLICSIFDEVVQKYTRK